MRSRHFPLHLALAWFMLSVMATVIAFASITTQNQEGAVSLYILSFMTIGFMVALYMATFAMLLYIFTGREPKTVFGSMIGGALVLVCIYWLQVVTNSETAQTIEQYGQQFGPIFSFVMGEFYAAMVIGPSQPQSSFMIFLIVFLVYITCKAMAFIRMYRPAPNH